MIWHESPTEPPNLLAARLDGSTGGPPRPLTAWPDPHPQLTGIPRRLVAHDRGDGVALSGMLYLPPGHDPARDGRLPLLVWAYPFDFGSADTAGQIRASSHRVHPADRARARRFRAAAAMRCWRMPPCR